MNKYSLGIAFFTILGALLSFCIRGSARRTSSAPYLKKSPLFVILTDLTLENTSIIGLLSYVYALLHGACFGAIIGFLIEGAIIGNDPREYTFNENYLTQMVLKILVCVAILVVSRVTIESYVVFIRTAENASEYFAAKRLKETMKDERITPVTESTSDDFAAKRSKETMKDERITPKTENEWNITPKTGKEWNF